MKRFFLIAVLTAMAVSCETASAGEDPVLAKVGDRKITLSDLERVIEYYDPNQHKLLEQSPTAKVNLLKRIVQGQVISGIAKSKGFDKEAAVREQLEMLSNDFIATEYLKKEVIAKINVTEEDAAMYYKAHKEEFKTPEMVRARHILIRVDKNAPEEEKKKAKDRAEDVLRRIKAGEDFAKLASEVSDDPGSKTKGGDIGFFPKGRMLPDFEKIVFSMKPGQLSDVVETSFGYHVVRVEERTEPVLEPYEKVKDKVREKVFNDLRKTRIEEFIEKALKDAGVELNTEPLLQKKP